MKRKFGFFLVTLLVTLFLVTAHDAYADHDDIVVLVNTDNGPVLRIYGLDGTFKARRRVLRGTFTELGIDSAVDVGLGSGHEKILVWGNSPTGPRIELWERDFSSSVGSPVLRPGFTEVSADATDLTGDRADEIVVIGRRRQVFHIEVYDQTGNLLFRGPLASRSDLDADFIVCFNDECGH